MSMQPTDPCVTSHHISSITPARLPGLRPAALARAKAHIDEHLFRCLRLSNVARAACMSRHHFSRCFAASMGMTLMAYVAQRRIDAARSALDHDPDLDLASLAAELGFCDQAHFSNVFRRICGTTPRKYANQSRSSGRFAGAGVNMRDSLRSHALPSPLPG